jgi:uncharacterized membrane protein YebE (DUF533 family)
MPTQPLPPPINPRQMDILRAVASMAWADGQLEPDEIRLMSDEFAILFAKSEVEKSTLKQNLREYFDQNLPLDEIIPQIERIEDRKLVLRLAYQVIQASRRRPDEPRVNLDEAAAYQRLVRMLDLPADDVADIEASVIPTDEIQATGLIKALAARLHSLISS